jgi:hypothetical protein
MLTTERQVDMKVRVTEERCVVEEISYDVEIPDGTDIVEDLDFEIEDHLDRASDEVHRETVRANIEITNVEEITESEVVSE